MALHKTTELTGRPLDYVATLAAGRGLLNFEAGFAPSSNGAHAIELMNLGPVRLARYGSRPIPFQCVAEMDRPEGRFLAEGPTLEVAFCRVLALAELGPEVEVPDDVH